MLRKRRKRYVAPLLAIAILAIWAGTLTSVGVAAHAGTATAGRTVCKSSASSHRATPSPTPLSAETSFLAQKATEGWVLTPAGQSIVAGNAPAGLATQLDGRQVGPGQMVVATKSAASAPLRGLQRATRTAGFVRDVFLYCLAGETGNIDYEVHPGASEFVQWQEHNISTGGDRTRNGPTTGCPLYPPGDCLVYAYDAAPSPWAVAKGSIFVSPIFLYKQLDFAYC
jgi:hypothetical protein